MSDRVELAYSKNGLLVHGSLPIMPTEENGLFPARNYNDPLATLFSNGLLINLSTSYIFSGASSRTYRPHGLIFNPDKATIADIHEEDSFSSRGPGGLQTRKKTSTQSFDTLEALKEHLGAKYARSEDALSHNEVICSVGKDALLGFFGFAVTNSKPEDKIPLVAAWLFRQQALTHGVDLPVYAYDMNGRYLSVVSDTPAVILEIAGARWGQDSRKYRQVMALVNKL